MGGGNRLPSGNNTENNFHCEPNQIYVNNNITCICNNYGYWPHKQCQETFQTLLSKNNNKTKCQPNSYVIIQCNVCRCNSEGAIDRKHCTKNICNDEVQQYNTRKSNSLSYVHGTCKKQNWYALAPCQFCYCVNDNKLLCNTGHYTKKLALGSYNLTLCGKDLIKEAIQLTPGNQNSLQQNEVKNVMERSKKLDSTTPSTMRYTSKEQGHVVIEVNREGNENIVEDNIKGNDNEDLYSDSDEEYENVDVNNVIAREGIFTQMPYQDEEPDNSMEINYVDSTGDVSDQVADSDNEIVIESIVKPSPQHPKNNVVEISTAMNSILSYLKKTDDAKLKTVIDNKNLLKFSIPKVLEKVFKMALRRSMLTLKNDTKCVPGAVEAVKCNTCFCLKNAKMLCTKKVCK
ncbi:uncharacterized protein LOC131849691 [Achroia grisella]|uniref:uncharacterized protein LOC131849691 n=1 Tax=Achroia grisella TaxID=688607 RepID=UPI0027D2A7F0|nr:uncharacterized protein LOC131849691 [Achroia grisella]